MYVLCNNQVNFADIHEGMMKPKDCTYLITSPVVVSIEVINILI